MYSSETDYSILTNSPVRVTGSHYQSIPDTNVTSLAQESPNYRFNGNNGNLDYRYYRPNTQPALQMPHDQLPVPISNNSNDLTPKMPAAARGVTRTSGKKTSPTWLFPEHLQQIKAFITDCRANPNIIHIPQLAFFKDYLESLGNNVPASKVMQESILTSPSRLESNSASESNSVESDKSPIGKEKSEEYDAAIHFLKVEIKENDLETPVLKDEVEENVINYDSLNNQLTAEKIIQAYDRHSDAMVDTGKRRHKCRQCDKAFSLKYNLTRHMRIHTGERPYQCMQCEKTFIDHTSLKNHLKIHSGERPYQCSQCDKDFSMKQALTRHMRVHTGEKPYQCIKCDKAFADVSILNKHLRRHAQRESEKGLSCIVFSQ